MFEILSNNQGNTIGKEDCSNKKWNFLYLSKSKRGLTGSFSYNCSSIAISLVKLIERVWIFVEILSSIWLGGCFFKKRN